MKHLSKLLVALFAGMAFSTASAQSESQPWAIKVGTNAVDFAAERDLFFTSRPVRTKNFNILPSISELSVSRYIKHGISGTLGGSINRIDRLGTNPNNFAEPFRISETSYYSLEGMVSYDLRHAFKKQEGWFAPFLGLGAGYNWIDDEGFFTGNMTIGIDFWIAENIAISIESTYKGNFAEYDNPDENIAYALPNGGTRLDQVSHLQHSAGIKFAFGGADSDGDGITDKKDECPDVAGLKEFNGCPDTDLDGIKDSEDNCPEEPGTAENGGCPDTDNDGVVDKDDSCPEVAGLEELNGCPDADGDGVTDNIDGCPSQAGPAANSGCPYTDKDGDGVLDKDDKCPEVAGVAANDGCPEIKEPTVEVQKQLNAYAKTILFDTGKSSIKSQSESVLRDIINILNEYPTAKFTIDGHTDSVGSASSNQRLSDSRAASVKNYLINGGVASTRLTSRGYGETSPISPNTTKAGRANNRRVEINLVK